MICRWEWRQERGKVFLRTQNFSRLRYFLWSSVLIILPLFSPFASSFTGSFLTVGLRSWWWIFVSFFISLYCVVCWTSESFWLFFRRFNDPVSFTDVRRKKVLRLKFFFIRSISHQSSNRKGGGEALDNSFHFRGKLTELNIFSTLRFMALVCEGFPSIRGSAALFVGFIFVHRALFLKQIALCLMSIHVKRFQSVGGLRHSGVVPLSIFSCRVCLDDVKGNSSNCLCFVSSSNMLKATLKPTQCIHVIGALCSTLIEFECMFGVFFFSKLVEVLISYSLHQLIFRVLTSQGLHGFCRHGDQLLFSAKPLRNLPRAEVIKFLSATVIIHLLLRSDAVCCSKSPPLTRTMNESGFEWATCVLWKMTSMACFTGDKQGKLALRNTSDKLFKRISGFNQLKRSDGSQKRL